IHVDPSKIDAVKNWKAPRTPTKGEEHELEFQTLKDKLCNAPILALPDGLKDFVVYCDASGIGLGCVLMQRKSLDEMIEQRNDGTLYYLDRIWVPLKGDVRTLIMNEAHKSKYSVNPGADKMYYDLRDRYWWPKMKKDIADYADKRRKPLEFSVGDYVLLKVSSWKGVVEKKGKLAPRFVGPFEIIKKVGFMAYWLDLPEELHSVHDTFHVSNLKKCLVDPTLQVPLDEI
nr:putative reverse transcriptase domain-containing protein [Tanacetum cinerariifolium]